MKIPQTIDNRTIFGVYNIFSWKICFLKNLQPTLTPFGTKGKLGTNNNGREKSKPFGMFIWIRVNFISRLYSWGDMFPFISFCTGWQANDSRADRSISCRNRTGEHFHVSPLDNEPEFWMQPGFSQDKQWCDRLVVDEATQPEDLFYIQGLY